MNGHSWSVISQAKPLGDRATYFYSSGSRHWYDTQANISRRAKDRAQRLTDDEVWTEIVRRLEAQRRSRSGFAAVSAAQEDTPRTCRTNRNMVVFLAGDSERLAELAVSVRQFLAWTAVVRGRTELTGQQIAQAQERRDRADQTTADRLLGAYHWILVPEQKQADKPFQVTAVKAEASATSLAERVTRKLQHGGQLAESHTARLIRMDLDSVLSSLWQEGHIGVGELWTYYARYPYLRRLRNREMLGAAVRSSAEQLHWQLEGFALAESYDADSDRYSGLVLPHDRITVTTVHDGLLIVSPGRAEAQRAR